MMTPTYVVPRRRSGLRIRRESAFPGYPEVELLKDSVSCASASLLPTDDWKLGTRMIGSSLLRLKDA